MARTRRAQILMEPAEYEQLESLARQRRVSVAELIRAAVRAQYRIGEVDRRSAVEAICAMSIPSIGSWADIEREIEDGHAAGIP